LHFVTIKEIIYYSPEANMEKKSLPNVGFRVEGEILSVKGKCNCDHRAGEKYDLSGHNTAGLCGFFYHDIFPYIIMLQFGGGFPIEWGGPDVLELECMDRKNVVRIRLTRQK
jgi:uncharacterized repeat protein (TIGR04076 family)